MPLSCSSTWRAAVSAFIWPQTNIDELQKLGHEVIDSHRQLMRRYREEALDGKGDEDADAGAEGKGETQKQVRDRAGQFLRRTAQLAGLGFHLLAKLRLHEQVDLFDRIAAPRPHSLRRHDGLPLAPDLFLEDHLHRGMDVCSR